MADEKYGGVPIKKLPPGKALGADDLTNWSVRRVGGSSGLAPRDDRAAIFRCRKCDVVVDVLVSVKHDAKRTGQKCRVCKTEMRFIKFKPPGFKR